MLGVLGGCREAVWQAPLKSTEGLVLSVGSGLLEGLEAGEGGEWWLARGKLGQLEYRLSQGLPREQVGTTSRGLSQNTGQKEGENPRYPGAITKLRCWEAAATVYRNPLCCTPSGSPLATLPLR